RGEGVLEISKREKSRCGRTAKEEKYSHKIHADLSRGPSVLEPIGLSTKIDRVDLQPEPVSQASMAEKKVDDTICGCKRRKIKEMRRKQLHKKSQIK
ncbi:hypothetical protein CRG98_022092, partial [Punica granatum]